MKRAWWFLAVLAAVGTAGFFAWRGQTTAQPNNPGDEGNGKPPAQVLPLKQVVLFSSGVGYFQREGVIDGNARVDLTFPVGDVNDLLKSLVVLDLDPDKATAVGYDSQEPVERTLQSFALNLTGNPTMGQLLNQARGEKVEVALQTTATGQPATLTGVIMGMETQSMPHGKDQVVEAEMLNLLCSEGLRGVKLTDVQRLRFLNSQLDSEFRRALEVLANSHNSQKRNLSLTLSGEGKRPIRIGYVVENPLWKTTYRLIHDRDGKVRLQGWALIENTSEDDWKDVKVSLVSSRPISYQMDLYQPLYVPRPTVEPERFASLRPPVFGGSVVDGSNNTAGNQNLLQGGNLGGGFQIGGGFNIGGQGGFNLGGVNPMLNNGMNPNWAANGNTLNRFQNGTANTLNFQQARLTFEDMRRNREQLAQAREQAKKIGSGVGHDPVEGLEGEQVGDYFRYDLNQTVTLPRLKSAMLPIVNKVIDGAPVSIYNEAIHRTAPLLGLRLKNTSGQHLMAGPVTVFEGGAYAGDARLPDVQPNEERLVGFAIDQGVEVVREEEPTPHRLVSARIVKGALFSKHTAQESTRYRIKNRTPNARKIIVSHPYRQEWKITSAEKPLEQTRDLYRFEVKVEPSKTVDFVVTEERALAETVRLFESHDEPLRLLLKSQVISEPVKAALVKVLGDRKNLEDLRKEVTTLQARLKAIGEDQTRMRANFANMPRDSAAYKRYLEKFDAQETQIEKLQADIEAKQGQIEERTKGLEKSLETLNVE